MPWFGGVAPEVPGLTSRATSPVAELEFSVTVTGTIVPCTVFAGTLSVKVVVVGVKRAAAVLQLFTRLLASTDPRPVARSYPVVVTQPRTLELLGLVSTP